MNGLRIGSLFSGIGGIELGLERAGIGQTVWQCEIDPWARRVLAKHWPGVPCHDDVRTFQPAHGSADLVCGGFPCQDLSKAGKQEGIQGARSGLWREFARIVRQVRPRYVVVENVPPLLDLGMGTVLGDLAACGYDAEWDCLPAAALGAPHIRDRVFILAYANGGGHLHREPGELPAKGRFPALSLSRGGGEAMADTMRNRRQQPLEGSIPGGHHHHGLGHQEAAAGRREHIEPGPAGAVLWQTEPDVGRVADGVPLWMDRITGLGNAVCPPWAEWVGGRIRMIEEQRNLGGA